MKKNKNKRNSGKAKKQQKNDSAEKKGIKNPDKECPGRNARTENEGPEHEEHSLEASSSSSITNKNTNARDKNSSDRIAQLSSFWVDLKLDPTSKLTLNKVRAVDKHTLTDKELTSPGQIPDYILGKLMIVDYHAREFKLESSTLDGDNDNNFDQIDDENPSEDAKRGVNPMDALLGIFYCSDIFLRQDLALKLSLCQLSVPLLLPDPAAPERVTILLSALGSITKSWNDASADKKGAQEVFAIEYPFPVVSFIRIGEPTMSKSFLINKIMSDASRLHNYFFHKDTKGGNIKRKFFDGLVELSWYLPGENKEITFKKEICFSNLRGDARDFKKQKNFLSKISSVLCILLPSELSDESMKRVLEEALRNIAIVILIFNEKETPETQQYLKNLSEHNKNLIRAYRAKFGNDYDFVQKLRDIIQKNVSIAAKSSCLVELASCANEYGIDLDLDDKMHNPLDDMIENFLKPGIENAKKLMQLQTYVPRLADLEREKYRPKRQSNGNESDRNIHKVYEEIKEEKRKQRSKFHQMDKNVLRCLNYVAPMNETRRNHTLKKMKHQLDKMSRQVMGKLHQEYYEALLKHQKKKKKEAHNKQATRSPELQNLIKLEDSIRKWSFGLEHIIRELAQLYQLSDLPTNDYAAAAAEMLLSGQPLEILDGDSSYIPLRWFEAVYTKLEHITKNAKVYVISVLGIQSSGKSTMLNTMFGLEFPVSAGRCTRGAFASLIPVSESLKSVSKFDYILILDTEGLRGSADPKLREHDNELATFAIGVADLTIVNIFGESLSEMKEFLEIAVHAFLKMKLVKEKKTCRIVHQNVAATDATKKLTVDRVKLKEDLDTMTKIAAIHENCEDRFQTFDKIISFDESEDVFYMPNLFQGSPPMAPMNPDYGTAVQKIRENIATLMCSEGSFKRSFSQFRERVYNLWEAILKENFIFSFRNVVEVRAYTSLERKFFEETLNIVRGMTRLEMDIQHALRTCSTRQEREGKWAEKKVKIVPEAAELGIKMEKEIKVFFETNEDAAILEQWKETMTNKIRLFKENQISEVTKNCSTTFSYLQERQDIVEMKVKYKNDLLKKAKSFMTSAHDTKDVEFDSKAAFDKEWKEWIADVPESEVQKIDVNNAMMNVLVYTEAVLSVDMADKLKEQNYTVLYFKNHAPEIGIDDVHMNNGGRIMNLFSWPQKSQALFSAKIISNQAINEALEFAKNASQPGVRCTRNDLVQMYAKVITTINRETEKIRLRFQKGLICDVLLHTFARAYQIFNEMEERYVRERDIRGDLERNLRPELETHFQNLCSKIGKEVTAASSFSDVLQKAIESALNRSMGDPVAETIHAKSNLFQSKGEFHATVLIELGEKENFDLYKPYLENPVGFLKTKLQESIEDFCLKNQREVIIPILTKSVETLETEVFEALSSASQATTKLSSEELPLWIERFVKTCSTLEITKETFAVAAIEDLEKIDVFEDEVQRNVAKFFKELKEQELDRAAIRKWNPTPHDNLLSHMFDCQSFCPFCKGLCDHIFGNHEEKDHSTLMHRPQCLTGYRYENTGKLVLALCPHNIASDANFRNAATSQKYHPFKEYRSVNDYYASWDIPGNITLEVSTYWQWFIAKFSKELAEYHNAKEPEIQYGWKRHTFEEVKEQLRREYRLNMPKNT